MSPDLRQKAGERKRPPPNLWGLLAARFTPLLLTCTLLFPGSSFAAKPWQPAPALVIKAKTAEQAMMRLNNLQRQALGTRQSAEAVERHSEETESIWHRVQQADKALGVTLKAAQECIPVLNANLAAQADAERVLQQAVAETRTAVETVAAADAAALFEAARSADGAFARRTASEGALAATYEALRVQANLCVQRVRAGQRSQTSFKGLAQDFADQARAIGPRRVALRQRWAATASAFDAATQAGWLNAPAPQLASRDQNSTAALSEALAEAKDLSPAGSGRALPAGPLTPQRANLDRLWTELVRLQDAASYVATATEPAAGDCQSTACKVFAAERRALDRRMADTQVRLRQAAAQWRETPESLGDQLAKSRTAHQALADQLAPVAKALGPFTAETRQEGQTIAAAADQLYSVARPAYEQARRDWEAAYRLAYGRGPETLDRQSASASMNGAAIAEAPAMAMMAPDIRSHAYHLFSQFDGEIAGFGAYTYVLVRSASDMATPAVKRRFQKLLTTLRKLPDATLVPPDQARLVNVFCIPVSPGAEDEARPSEVQYASDLGQQLKLRAQNGLLTQKAVRHRLTDAPGPFLITLPARLSEARSATPVLIADLSTYPEDAIADLATHYMNGLVDDFPTQQALWKPPRLQRVALFMIHLAEATGQLVDSAMPTVQAGPR